MRKIVSYRSFRDESGESMPGEGSERDYPCEPDEIDHEEGLTAVDLAVDVIMNKVWCHEPSACPGWQRNMWYARSDEPDQLSPAGAHSEETTAHLEGFTDDEQRAVYGKLRERGWLTA